MASGTLSLADHRLGHGPGRLHHKLLAEKDLFEVVMVPGGSKAFVLDAQLERVVVFQQAQGCSTENTEVRVGVAATQARLVFLKRHVELPMQAILDRPMIWV